MNTISIQNVSKSFGQHKVLNNINLNCEKGFIYGIVGYNGSGKTVLFKSICGFIKPDSGVVTIKGKPNSDISKFNLGVIIEAPAYISELSGIDNLSYLYEIKNKKNRKYLEEVMRLVGLDPLSKKKVSKYSMGMKQRLAIAQAIMEEQDILILDEPTAGLDPGAHREILNLIRDVHESQNNIIIFVSHNMADIADMSDKVMVRGKLITVGTPQEVFSRKDRLDSIALNVPPITDMMHRLRAEGIDIDTSPLDIKSGEETIYNYLKRIEMNR